MVYMSIFEFVTSLVRDESCTREDSKISEHFFFLVTKTWGLDSENGENSLELIEDDSCEGLSINIISYDDEFTLATLCE